IKKPTVVEGRVHPDRPTLWDLGPRLLDGSSLLCPLRFRASHSCQRARCVETSQSLEAVVLRSGGCSVLPLGFHGRGLPGSLLISSTPPPPTSRALRSRAL